MENNLRSSGLRSAIKWEATGDEWLYLFQTSTQESENTVIQQEVLTTHVPPVSITEDLATTLSKDPIESLHATPTISIHSSTESEVTELDKDPNDVKTSKVKSDIHSTGSTKDGITVSVGANVEDRLTTEGGLPHSVYDVPSEEASRPSNDQVGDFSTNPIGSSKLDQSAHPVNGDSTTPCLNITETMKMPVHSETRALTHSQNSTSSNNENYSTSQTASVYTSLPNELVLNDFELGWNVWTNWTACHLPNAYTDRYERFRIQLLADSTGSIENDPSKKLLIGYYGNQSYQICKYCIPEIIYNIVSFTPMGSAR